MQSSAGTHRLLKVDSSRAFPLPPGISTLHTPLLTDISKSSQKTSHSFRGVQQKLRVQRLLFSGGLIEHQHYSAESGPPGFLL